MSEQFLQRKKEKTLTAGSTIPAAFTTPVDCSMKEFKYFPTRLHHQLSLITTLLYHRLTDTPRIVPAHIQRPSNPFPNTLHIQQRKSPITDTSRTKQIHTTHPPVPRHHPISTHLSPHISFHADAIHLTSLPHIHPTNIVFHVRNPTTHSPQPHITLAFLLPIESLRTPSFLPFFLSSFHSFFL